jgi:pilus assembly protein CpaB
MMPTLLGRRSAAGGLAPRRLTRTARAWRLVRRHRRLVAAGLLAVAAGLTVEAVEAEAPSGVPVTVAARDLPAGQVLSASDLTSVVLAEAAVPDGTLAAPQLDGRALASPARRGEPLTDARLAGRGQLVATPPGTVAVPVPVSDPTTLSMLGRGDAVRVIAGSTVGDGLDVASGDPARVLVQRAVVLATPETASTGLLGSGEGAGSLVLAMSTPDAVKIADATERRYLGVVLLP